MFQIFSVIIEHHHAPIFTEIGWEWDISRRHARIDVPGVVRTEAQPLLNPVTDEEHRIITTLPHGWVFHEAEGASGSAKGIGDIKFDLSSRQQLIGLRCLGSKWFESRPRGVPASFPAVRLEGSSFAGVTFDLESVLRRDRLVVVIALGAVMVLSWAYVLAGAGMGMSAMEMTRMTHAVGLGGSGQSGLPMSGMNGTLVTRFWSVGYAVIAFFMWWIMMLGMMLPSAAPMLLLFARMMRKEKEKGAPYVPTGVFALGYAVMWAAFSGVATGAQWGLESIGLLSAMMVGTSTVFGAVLLIAAGIWQLTPLKQACLKHCRSPIGFLSSHWRSGRAGAFPMIQYRLIMPP